jgi:lipid A ethanolaminephosphotransferase
MNTYNVIIDDSMIRNMLQTNIDESMDLLTVKQILYFIFLGLIPSLLVYKMHIKRNTFSEELISKIKLIIISLLIIIISMFSFSKYYTSFLREHKPLRYNINPTYWLYSIGSYISKTLNSGPIIVAKTGLDATIKDNNLSQKIVIMIVGEAARADHFSLNGYTKETNPLLRKQNIINFSNTYSCGTATAKSVPCMFSYYTRDNYTYKKGISKENVLDVLNHTNKIAITWRDNNSDSKGVAIRLPYESYKNTNTNTICDIECRDEGMLVGLDEYIKQNKTKDILIVLHQMGNHGPAYFKRYPKSFEKFTPVCNTNQLENCTQEEISNAYDNAILYTDYFLNKTINFLKKYKNKQTAMIYMADHGESLGENGIYLHGLPYFMAPDSQKHIGSIMWFSNKIQENININNIIKDKDKSYSQDNLFHTLLGLFNVNTNIYRKEMDIINDN